MDALSKSERLKEFEKRILGLNKISIIQLDRLNEELLKLRNRRNAKNSGVYSYLRNLSVLCRFNGIGLNEELCVALNREVKEDYVEAYSFDNSYVVFFLEYIIEVKGISRRKLTSLVGDYDRNQLRIMIRKARQGKSKDILLSTLIRYLNGLNVDLCDFIHYLYEFILLIDEILLFYPKLSGWKRTIEENRDSAE